MNAQVDGTGAATANPMEADVTEASGDGVDDSRTDASRADAERVDLVKAGRPVAAVPVDPASVVPHTEAIGSDRAADPERVSAPQVVVQEAPALAPVPQRIDFGAHLEGNYQRLVAQLYAITLDPGEAHDAVQDAYSRAWRRWPEIVAATDPTDWVRRVAVRTTQRSWRRVLARLGLSHPRPVGDADPRTAALLAALGRLPATERRAVVLHHMVGMSHGEIATLELVGTDTVRDRLRRAHLVVTEGMADELPSVLGLPPEPGDARYGQETYAAYGDHTHDHTYDDRYADERLR